MTLIEALMKTGLTRHESELYVALSRDGEANGYEAAKHTGIPRANVYQALAGLVEKGGANVIDGDVLRYAAVPVGEYCTNAMRSMESVTEIITRDCPTHRAMNEPYLTISGEVNITNKLKNLILSAKERVYISISNGDLPLVQEELLYLAERGLKVVIITSGKPDIPGARIYSIQKQPGSIHLIVDSSHVLTGQCNHKSDDVCLYSKNQPLIELVKDALKNEIKLSDVLAGQ